MSTENSRNTNGIVFRNPKTEDGKYFWEITRASGTLDVNSPYYYLMMCHHFGSTCMAAEKQGRLVGFVIAYIPPETPDTIFVWQVAVDEKERGQGIGRDMLVKVFNNAKTLKVKYLDATITPSNKASISLFTAAAKALNASFEFNTTFFSEQDFGPNEHEPELLFHIGPVLY